MWDGILPSLPPATTTADPCRIPHCRPSCPTPTWPRSSHALRRCKCGARFCLRFSTPHPRTHPWERGWMADPWAETDSNTRTATTGANWYARVRGPSTISPMATAAAFSFCSRAILASPISTAFFCPSEPPQLALLHASPSLQQPLFPSHLILAGRGSFIVVVRRMWLVRPSPTFHHPAAPTLSPLLSFLSPPVTPPHLVVVVFFFLFSSSSWPRASAFSAA